MAHFAKVENGIVTEVLVVEPEVVAMFPDAAYWVQTSYNTIAGEHIFGGVPLRKNYAAIGYAYDPILDAFIPPKEYPSWILNETTGMYEAPVPRPLDTEHSYEWIEETQSWKLIPE